MDAGRPQISGNDGNQTMNAMFYKGYSARGGQLSRAVRDARLATQQAFFRPHVAACAARGPRTGRRRGAGGWWLVAGGWWLVAGVI